MTTNQVIQVVEKNLARYVAFHTPAMEAFAHRIIADIIDLATAPAAPTAQNVSVLPPSEPRVVVKREPRLGTTPYTCAFCHTEGIGRKNQRVCHAHECRSRYGAIIATERRLTMENPGMAVDLNVVLNSVSDRTRCECPESAHTKFCRLGDALGRYNAALEALTNPTARTT